MQKKVIDLIDIPDEVMLVLEYPSGVVYRAQVGGVVCWKAEMEGVLVPIDLSDDSNEQIMNCAYPQGREGVTAEIADMIDARLASEAGARFLRVDRARLDESWEAWVYVIVDSPPTPPPDMSGEISADTFGGYFGPVYGFGLARGVLTWPNSD